MKTILAATTAVLMAVCLSGCGGEKTYYVKSTSTSPLLGNITLYFSLHDKSNLKGFLADKSEIGTIEEVASVPKRVREGVRDNCFEGPNRDLDRLDRL